MDEGTGGHTGGWTRMGGHGWVGREWTDKGIAMGECQQIGGWVAKGKYMVSSSALIAGGLQGPLGPRAAGHIS